MSLYSFSSSNIPSLPPSARVPTLGCSPTEIDYWQDTRRRFIRMYSKVTPLSKFAPPPTQYSPCSPRSLPHTTPVTGANLLPPTQYSPCSPRSLPHTTPVTGAHPTHTLRGPGAVGRGESSRLWLSVTRSPALPGLFPSMSNWILGQLLNANHAKISLFLSWLFISVWLGIRVTGKHNSNEIKRRKKPYLAF